MADMVVCKVYMTGIAKEDLYSKWNDGSIYFDFNKIIPEPETEDDCPGKYITTPETTCCQTIPEKPWFDWYNWNIDNWGTKWNTFDTKILNDNCVRFLTAWCCPEKIFEKLSKMYPNRTVRIKFATEFNDIRSEIKFKNGYRQRMDLRM